MVVMVVSGRRCQVWALLSLLFIITSSGVKQQIVSDSVDACAVVTLSHDQSEAGIPLWRPIRVSHFVCYIAGHPGTALSSKVASAGPGPGANRKVRTIGEQLLQCCK